MSRLYLNEEGRVIPSLCEELTSFRRARTVLDLAATEKTATLYILARPYPDVKAPLRLAINGREAASIAPEPAGAYRWWDVDLDPSLLVEGSNSFELWTDATAMNAWSLALEAGHAAPRSALSDDGGENWRSERMGYLNAVRGEYVVRLRLQEGEDPQAPAMIWEDASSARAAALRQAMPAAACEQRSDLEKVRILSAWLASSFEHTSSLRGFVYTPWDAETIVAWGNVQQGHYGKRPVDMCVHYAAALVSACQVLEIPARCAVMTGSINGSDGHFVSEVWLAEYGKWVMVDPNTDAICWKDGAPLSISEIQQQGGDLSGVLEWGEGTEFQRTFPHIVDFIRDNLEQGVCFACRSIWPRADLLAHPEYSPPGHGALAYCETALVWEERDLQRGFGMFPYFAGPEYFDAPPST